MTILSKRSKAWQASIATYAYFYIYGKGGEVTGKEIVNAVGRAIAKSPLSMRQISLLLKRYYPNKVMYRELRKKGRHIGVYYLRETEQPQALNNCDVEKIKVEE